MVVREIGKSLSFAFFAIGGATSHVSSAVYIILGKGFALRHPDPTLYLPVAFPLGNPPQHYFFPSDLNFPARMTRPVTIKIYDRNSIASRAEANGIKAYVLVSTRFPLTLVRKALTKKSKALAINCKIKFYC